MSLIKKDLPYEFLVRWGFDGKIAGVHVQRRIVIEENGVIISEKLTNAVSVKDSGDYPLSDIIGEITQATIVENEKLKAELNQLKAKSSKQDNKDS